MDIPRLMRVLFEKVKQTTLLQKITAGFFLLLIVLIIIFSSFVTRGLSYSPVLQDYSGLPAHPDGTLFNHPVEGFRRIPGYSLFLFFVKHNPNINQFTLLKMISIYTDECLAENINLAAAFAQMCHETGFLKFGGSVSSDQNNFAGIGAVSSDSPGNTFPDRTTGVRAQIQHLKAYASDMDLVRECVDPRFRYVKRKSAPGIFDLAGKWAADPHYGKKLLKYIMEIYSYIPANTVPE